MKTLIFFFLPFATTLKGTEIKPGISKITQAVPRPDNFNSWMLNVKQQLNECKRSGPRYKNRMYSKSQFNF